ncbi:MAG TPA: hypothetical protein PLP25_06545, partial [Candidatus Limiplasma sp.]|nr:hypothetical protein [Candidatus Limiplasma sp.]
VGVVSVVKMFTFFESFTMLIAEASETAEEVMPTEPAKAVGAKTLRVQIASRSEMPLRRVWPTLHLPVVMVSSLHFHAFSLLLLITFYDPKSIPIILQFYYIVKISVPFYCFSVIKTGKGKYGPLANRMKSKNPLPSRLGRGGAFTLKALPHKVSSG